MPRLNKSIMSSGPVNAGRSQMMAPVIAGLMAPSPPPRTTMEGATQAASKIAGAVVAGMMEKHEQDKQNAVNDQMRTIMSSGPDFTNMLKAYDALPAEQRSPELGMWLSQQQAQLAMQRAAQKPSVHVVGDSAVMIDPDGTARAVYEGPPKLSGDAANLRAINNGRMPTLEELKDLKAGPEKFTTATREDAWGNKTPMAFNTRTGQFGAGPGGGGAVPIPVRAPGPGAMPAGLGAGPARGGAMPVNAFQNAAPTSGGGALPDTAQSFQERQQFGAGPGGLGAGPFRGGAMPAEMYTRPTPSGNGGAASGADTNTGGSVFNADGSPARLPGGVKWRELKDERLADGTMASVQWDTTGNFYRVRGKAKNLEQQEKPLPFEQASKLAGIKNAYDQVNDLANSLFDDKGKLRSGDLWKSYIPGTREAQYQKQAYQAVEAWLRAMSGAAVPEQEVRRYLDAYMPNPWDDESVAKNKFVRLRAQFTETLRLMGRPIDTQGATPAVGKNTDADTAARALIDKYGGRTLVYNPKTGKLEGDRR